VLPNTGITTSAQNMFNIILFPAVEFANH